MHSSRIRSGAGFQLQMQVFQATDDEAGLVVEPPVARRSVLLNREADVGSLLQQTVQQNAHFRARQRRADAGMGSTAKCQVFLDLLAPELELGWLLPAAR